jgi:hypothetical protein
VGDGRSMMKELGKFVVLAAVLFFVAWLAKTGRVAYDLIMIWIAGGLAFAVLDLAGYELVKKKRHH